MGTEQSKVKLGTPEQYQIQQRKRKQQHAAIKQSQSFFKIQPCYYPHSLMEKHPSFTKNTYQKRCTRKHDKYHDSYNLCSECQRKPQKIIKNTKIFYEKTNFKLEKPQPQSYQYNDPKFKQKQVLAPGPQIPGFYNGFSLPVDKFYKQKTQISDHVQQIKDSIYREENKEIQQSIYEERPSKYSQEAQEIQIDYEGFQQNLRF